MPASPEPAAGLSWCWLGEPLPVVAAGTPRQGAEGAGSDTGTLQAASNTECGPKTGLRGSLRRGSPQASLDLLLIALAAAAQRGAWPQGSPGLEELTGRASLPASPSRRGWEVREQREQLGVINTVCWSRAQIAARSHKSPSRHRR